MTSPEPITAQPVTPLSREAWEAQYQLGALLTGPFDEADPQVALRVAHGHGEPVATPENIADFLHEECVKCEDCHQFWLYEDDDRPTYENDSGFLCDDCAPCTTRRQRDPDGWKARAGR